MPTVALSLIALFAISADPLAPGDHDRSLKMGEQSRSYLVHVPPKYDPQKPTPVVLILHGAMMNGAMMAPFCGMNDKADEAGFVAVYPSGTGAGSFLTWDAGGFGGKGAKEKPDDVKFIAAVLDDLATAVNVDSKRVYSTGMSNGGMMCYRLAAELSDRIAAVAPVAGTMAIEKANPKRPVPLIHFHGTADKLVPFDGLGKGTSSFISLKSVEASIQAWVKIDGCDEKPEITDVPDKANDGTTVQRKLYGHGKDGAEVVLYVINDGGHTWPGRPPPVKFLGKSTKNISANDLIWEFFEKHPMK